MNVYLEIAIRSASAFLVLFLLAELLGVKHIAQLTFFDYIVGITIGSIAGTMCIDSNIPVWYGLIGMVVFALLSLVVSIINRKTIWGRRIFTGNPTFLISEGQILYKELARANFNIHDLLRELRTNGYYNIADIQHAILETNGQVSIMPKVEKAPLTVGDMNLSIPQEQLSANVIIDRKILFGNLKAMNKDEKWLMNEIKRQNQTLKNIILATLDIDGSLSIYSINKGVHRRTMFQ